MGIGECSPMHPRLVAETINSALKPIIIGRDLFDIEKISEDVFIETYKFRGRLVFMAFSGIEVAIWEAIGKALKLPIYKLLGGEYRKNIKVYVSFMHRDQSPKEIAERAEYFVASTPNCRYPMEYNIEPYPLKRYPLKGTYSS